MMLDSIKDKAGSISPRLMGIIRKARVLTGMSERHWNDVVRDMAETAERKGITVEQQVENVDRTFWALLSEPEKEHLRALGMHDPEVRRLEFDFRKEKVKTW
jgi:hypothetical protein